MFIVYVKKPEYKISVVLNCGFISERRFFQAIGEIWQEGILVSFLNKVESSPIFQRPAVFVVCVLLKKANIFEDFEKKILKFINNFGPRFEVPI